MGTKKYIKNKKSTRRRNKRGTRQKQGYRGGSNSKMPMDSPNGPPRLPM